jgi:hypothetical protein
MADNLAAVALDRVTLAMAERILGPSGDELLASMPLEKKEWLAKLITDRLARQDAEKARADNGG